MKTRVLKIGNAKLAFGVSWSTLRGIEKQAKEIKVLAKDSKAERLIVFQKDGGGTVVGVLLNNRGVSGTVMSAAALFAHAVGSANAMFLYRFPDGVCVFIGAMHGIPTPGYDVVGTLDEVTASAAAFVELMSGGHVELYGNVEFNGQPKEATPETIAKADRQTLKKSVMRAAKPPVKAIALGMVVLAATLAGKLYYDQWQQEQLRKKQAQKTLVDPNITYRQALAPALATTGYKANVSVKTYVAAIDKLPMYHAGWELLEVACVPIVCDTTWKLSSGGTFKSFEEQKHLLPPFMTVDYQSDLKTIKAVFAIKQDETAQGQAEAALPTLKPFKLQFDTFSQMHDAIGVKIARDKQGVPTVFALPPNVVESQLADPVKVGTWELQSAYHRSDVINAFPENFTLDVFRVNVTPTGLTLFSEGKYYVKN